MTQDDDAIALGTLEALQDDDAIALGTLEALQGEVNAAIDGMKAKYLVNARRVDVAVTEEGPGGSLHTVSAPDADLYANPGFEETVRAAVTLRRLMREHGLEGIVVNGLGMVGSSVPNKAGEGEP